MLCLKIIYMSSKKIMTLTIIAITLSSLVFLIYTGSLYLKTFTLSHKIRISIQSLEVEQKNESFSVKTVFLLENPSELSLKITYLQEEIYSDSQFKHLLGRSMKKSPVFIPGSYLVLINAFSNDTLQIIVSLSKAPEKKLFIKFDMRVEDVPIVHVLYVTRHFSWKL